MKFSPQQDAALSAVNDWLRDPGDKQVFRLFGYAGTGKTTLAKHLAEGVSGTVLFGAYTGKAASVLRAKGCPASTIHSLIYVPKDKSRERLARLEEDLAKMLNAEPPVGEDQVEVLQGMIREERRALARPAFDLNVDSPVRSASLVVIDECSMVDARMGEDLLSFGKPVLVLGDPAQLPPVASGGFFTEDEPDLMLEEIHRQARDNPIIHMATAVREGKRLEIGPYGDSRVYKRQNVQPETAMQFEQIICGKNITRHSINRRCRELLGFACPSPKPDDRVVCLRNNHDIGLLNGTLWKVESAWHDPTLTVLEIVSDDGQHLTVDAWTAAFGPDGKLDEMPWWERKEAEEFDYGYALTCHKAQGSQFRDIMIFDESRVFRSNAKRWLYTALTRAEERVDLVVD